MPDDMPLPFLLGLIAVLLFSLSWHEAAHAWMADRLGDPTARELGRVTLNPLKHIDPFLSIILPGMLLLFGAPPLAGGKPVPIDVRNFRHRSRDFMLVAVAGPLSNLLLSVCFGGLYVLCIGLGMFVGQVDNPYGAPTPQVPSILFETDVPSFFWLQMGLLLNISLALFNLIPIPPLDGSRIVGWLLPGPLKGLWYRLDRYAFVIILLIYLSLQMGAGAIIADAIHAAWLVAAGLVDAAAQWVAIG
jgi:Zn-dependent protease